MNYVYILRSKSNPNKTYIGSTTHLNQRLIAHNSGKCSFTSRYRAWDLVYLEEYIYASDAIARERQLKKWTRAKKEALIIGDLGRLKSL